MLKKSENELQLTKDNSVKLQEEITTLKNKSMKQQVDPYYFLNKALEVFFTH